MRWRFMAVVMLITGLVLLVQTVPLAQYLRAVEYDRLITALERDAFILAGNSEEVLEASDPAELTLAQQAAGQYREAGGGRVVVVNIDGVAIVTSDDDESAIGGNYFSRPEIAEALGGTIASGSRHSVTLERQLVYVAVPILSGQDILGAVRLTYPEATADEAVNGRLSVISIVALLTLAMAGLAGIIFSGTVTRRLHVLTATTERLAAGDLSARADPNAGAPELVRLARSFNRMADRLAALIDEQREFAAHASHQLRTPLTALRLKLERARDLVESDPTGSSIEVTLTGGSHPSIRVTDDGPGMTDEEIAAAFEPFWRGSSTTAGTGLGLAIAAELTAASGATVTLARREPHRLAVVVSFEPA